jgi:HEPN domain-containing protein
MDNRMGNFTTVDLYLNDFATRSFRDTADEDYIMARSAYRAELYAQFLWSGLQAIEKYIKAILLYNRIAQPQKQGARLGHDLERGLNELKRLPFAVKLSKPSLDIITHLDTYGRFRYLDTPYHIHGDELIKLDRAVWELRLYCQVLNYTVELGDELVEMLPLNLAKIEKAMENPKPVVEFTGVIEAILSKKDHPARPALVWKNLFFNRHQRKTIKWRTHMHAVNSPLSLRPELLEDVCKYVWLPREVIRAYEEELRQRSSG